MNIRKIIQNLLGLSDKDMPEGENLEGFTQEQLDEARGLADASFKAALDAKDVSAATEATETLEAIAGEVKERAEAEATAEAELAALQARIDATNQDNADNGDESGSDDGDAGDGDSTNDGTDDSDADEGGTPPAAPETKVEVAKEETPAQEVKVPVAASAQPAPPAATPAKTKAVPTPSAPKTTKAAPKVTITAAADIQGHSAGTTLGVNDLGPAFVSKADAMSRGRQAGRLSVATLEVDYPEDRMLKSEDSTSRNTEKIEKVRHAAIEETRKQLAAILASTDAGQLATLTAEGGLCAPVNVRYDIYELGTDARPIRDGLTRFGATRGGIRFNAPPVLSDVAGSSAVYTEAQDASGTDYPKDCIRVDCGDDVEVKVSAIPLCMEVGNFQRLSFPENFAAWWRLGKVAHARLAEETLWARMKALSVHVTINSDGFGFARLLLAGVARATQQYRDRFRVGDEMPLRVFIPGWAATLAQVDFLRQAPGDSAVGLARSTISRYLAAFNVAVTYTLDGQPPTADGSYAQAAGGLKGWPATLDIIIEPEGSLLFLDMGELNFGTEIRDFDQIRNNDSGAFFETFENAANVGPQTLWVTFTNICANGKTSAPDDLDPCSGTDY